jgi:site-specific recombinase XerD
LLAFVDTAARLSEVISINWADIAVANGLIDIARGKGGKGRIIVVGI